MSEIYTLDRIRSKYSWNDEPEMNRLENGELQLRALEDSLLVTSVAPSGMAILKAQAKGQKETKMNG